MGLFDFVGTFFFLSLGITFVLILLLVYHFKQRLTDMEQKSDKMFEIVNTIVKEMGNMRRVISQIAQEPQDVLQPSASYREQDRYESDDDADADADDNQEGECFLHNSPIVYNIGDANRVMNDFFHINAHTVEDESIQEETDEQEHVEQVKVVSVDLTYNEDDVKTDEEASVLSDFGDFEPEDIHTTLPTSTSSEEVIHVNKLDESMTPIVDEEEHDVSSSHNEEQQIPYSKMNLTQLRAYAVSRGLLSDSGKMKKAELIKLLEGNDAENQQSSG